MRLPKLLTKLGVASLSVLACLAIAQPARSQLFCWPWETHCTPNGRLSNDPLGTGRNVISTFDVSIRNVHDRPIWVAIHYRYTPDRTCVGCSELAVMPSPGSDWTTAGYWRLEPGQVVLTDVSTTNRYIYFHAHDDDGHFWGNSDEIFQVGGMPQPFSRADMGGEIGRFTYTFR